MRGLIRRLLRRLGLLRGARAIRDQLNPETRERIRAERADLAELRRSTGSPLLEAAPRGVLTRRVLIAGMDSVSGVTLSSVVIRSFESAGYRPIVLVPGAPVVRAAYSLIGVDDVRSLDDYWGEIEPREASGFLRGASSIEEILAIRTRDVQVGKYAVSTLMRRTRQGTFQTADLRSSLLESALTYSLESAAAAERVLDDVAPDAVLFIDRGYSPIGQIFDSALRRGIPAFTWNAAHRDNSVMFKRYSAENRDEHPSALSAQSWARTQSIDWSEAHSQRVHRELRECYESGEWYGEAGTQLGTREVLGEDLIGSLGLDPRKRTAVIFPHIFWDSTFFWGTDLFANYEEWFVEVVRAAIGDPSLNWLIKVHPANVTKDRRDGVAGEHSEIAAIRKAFGTLPEHIKVIPAETDVSTLSLFGIMDYCLTVRGTVGIEAACFGVPVLTAGTGRYDRMGFTIDSATRDEYLQRVRNLASVPKLTDDQVQLAERYAYALFFSRPALLESVRMEFEKNVSARLRTRIATAAALSDVNRIAAWIDSGDEDYFEGAAPRTLPGDR